MNPKNSHDDSLQEYDRIDARQTDLEIKMMDLENSLAQLNAVIIRQADEIDTLRAGQQRLLGQLQALEDRGGESTVNEPPPHY